jgi:hypothetical protein
MRKQITTNSRCDIGHDTLIPAYWKPKGFALHDATVWFRKVVDAVIIGCGVPDMVQSYVTVY